MIEFGECIDEQLAKIEVKTSYTDAVLLTHFDCDHANCFSHVKDAKKFFVSHKIYCTLMLNFYFSSKILFIPSYNFCKSFEIVYDGHLLIRFPLL